MNKTRVLMYLPQFPTISQTYMMTEVEALKAQYELRIVTPREGDLPCKHHEPYELVGDKQRLRDIVAEFRPHILHGHYLYVAPVLAELGEKFGIPFTVRAHSFDTLKSRTRRPKLGYVQTQAALSDTCAGILAFPFVRPLLERIGIPTDRIFDCHPVIDYNRFHDRSPNGDGVLNVGACLPKKRMEDFVDLGTMVDKTLNLYAIGYQSKRLLAYNEENGSPIIIHRAVEPEEMPKVYKAHEWLVYTACPKLNTVGWSMAVAEAQAAGVGVCFPNIRPDISDYIGGAGFLYNSISEVPDIICRPYPTEMREIGFEQAKKSDISQHKSVLTDIWDRARISPPRIGKFGGSYTRYKNATAPLRVLQSAIGRLKNRQ